MIGTSFANQQVYSISKQMTTYLKVSDSTFSEIYSIYCAPNIILPFFAGQWIDKYGARKVTACFYTVCIIGNFIYSLGGKYSSWDTMLFGRFIFGIGTETYQTSVSIIVTKWFYDSNLNFAYGIAGISPCIAAVLGGVWSPELFGTQKDPHLGRTLMTGELLIVLCAFLVYPFLNLDQ